MYFHHNSGTGIKEAAPKSKFPQVGRWPKCKSWYTGLNVKNQATI